MTGSTELTKREDPSKELERVVFRERLWRILSWIFRERGASELQVLQERKHIALQVLQERKRIALKVKTHADLARGSIDVEAIKSYLELLNRENFARCNRLLQVSLKVLREAITILDEEELTDQRQDIARRLRENMGTRDPAAGEADLQELKTRKLRIALAKINETTVVLEEVGQLREGRNTAWELLKQRLGIVVSTVGEDLRGLAVPTGDALLEQIGSLEAADDELKNKDWVEIDRLIEKEELLTDEGEREEVAISDSDSGTLADRIYEALLKLDPMPIIIARPYLSRKIIACLWVISKFDPDALIYYCENFGKREDMIPLVEEAHVIDSHKGLDVSNDARIIFRYNHRIYHPHHADIVIALKRDLDLADSEFSGHDSGKHEKLIKQSADPIILVRGHRDSEVDQKITADHLRMIKPSDFLS